jgi:violaxanthin de-epoxidase
MRLFLSLLALVAGSQAYNPYAMSQVAKQTLDQEKGIETCVALHCAWESGLCLFDSVCFETLQCMTGCDGKPDESQCQFECEMTIGNGNDVFEDLLRCMAENDCFPEVLPDGICLPSPEDTVQTIESIDQVAGDWWVVRGVNCGQDDVWRGGYDWYPCQHERYLRIDDGSWINNTTYVGGTNSNPTTDVLVTIPHATMPSNGLIRLEYDDEPLLPQIERWHIVALPEDNYMMVLWCGTNPALDYNGGFVLSRTRTQDDMSPESEAAFREQAAKFGLDYDAMCVTDNSACAANP